MTDDKISRQLPLARNFITIFHVSISAVFPPIILLSSLMKSLARNSFANKAQGSDYFD
jgi:hypothetical protein